MNARLLAISISLLLSACTATQIHSYNDALVEFYSTKISARDAGDWNQYETATTGLENLAKEAEESAGEEAKAVNKISLYRIGATAAWQSDRKDDVIRIAGKGDDLCASDGNADLAPRDCAMLDVIPVLAAIDETTRSYELLNAEVVSTPKEQRETAHGAKTVELFDSAEQGVIALLDKRDNVNPRVSDGYKQMLDQNIGRAADVYNRTYTTLRTAHQVDPGDNGKDPMEAKANCRVIALKSELESRKLDSAAAHLVPEDENAACP